MTRRPESTGRDTIELALIAWVCSLFLIAAVAIPLFGLAKAALVALGLLVALLAVCFAICIAHPPRRRLLRCQVPTGTAPPDAFADVTAGPDRLSTAA